MSEINWGEPLENENGAPRYLFARVHASGKVLMHDGSYSHADFASELHQAGIRFLVSMNANFDGKLVSYKENGQPGPAYHDTFFGKSIIGTKFKLRNKGWEPTVEQMEDAVEMAGELWGVF